jgi:hypothetical protein
MRKLLAQAGRLKRYIEVHLAWAGKAGVAYRAPQWMMEALADLASPEKNAAGASILDAPAAIPKEPGAL